MSISGIDISAGHHGWSVRTLKGVVAEAGAHLERLQAETSETGKNLGIKIFLIHTHTYKCWLWVFCFQYLIFKPH